MESDELHKDSFIHQNSNQITKVSSDDQTDVRVKMEKKGEK